MQQPALVAQCNQLSVLTEDRVVHQGELRTQRNACAQAVRFQMSGKHLVQTDALSPGPTMTGPPPLLSRRYRDGKKRAFSTLGAHKESRTMSHRRKTSVGQARERRIPNLHLVVPQDFQPSRTLVGGHGTHLTGFQSHKDQVGAVRLQQRHADAFPFQPPMLLGKVQLRIVPTSAAVDAEDFSAFVSHEHSAAISGHEACTAGTVAFQDAGFLVRVCGPHPHHLVAGH
eukprot:scaffold110_cov315-Pavlova_lutheri.AAC.15